MSFCPASEFVAITQWQQLKIIAVYIVSITSLVHVLEGGKGEQGYGDPWISRVGSQH